MINNSDPNKMNGLRKSVQINKTIEIDFNCMSPTSPNPKTKTVMTNSFQLPKIDANKTYAFPKSQNQNFVTT